MMFEHRPYGEASGLGIAQSAPARAEHRNYTDVVVNALLQHAAGTLTLSPLGLAVLEAAAGALSRALALATVQPQTGRTAALTPSVRARIGRDLLRHGQSIHVIHIGRDGLELIPAHSVDPSGQPFEEWRYKLDIAGPDGTATRDYPASSVVHIRLASDAASPWSGVPPLTWAVTSARLGTALETRLGQEADGPVGNLIVAPHDPGPPAGEEAADGEDAPDPYAGAKRDLAGLRGELAIVESMNSDPRGEGGPRADWTPTRLGANPPATLPSLRADTEQCLAAALGYPGALLSPNSDGTAAREAYRRWHHGTLLPIADLVCEEVTAKLETACSLTFQRLEAGDISGRARAFGQMVKGGLKPVKAAELAGLQGVTDADVEAIEATGTPAQAGFGR